MGTDREISISHVQLTTGRVGNLTRSIHTLLQYKRLPYILLYINTYSIPPPPRLVTLDVALLAVGKD